MAMLVFLFLWLELYGGGKAWEENCVSDVILVKEWRMEGYPLCYAAFGSEGEGSSKATIVGKFWPRVLADSV